MSIGLKQHKADALTIVNMTMLVLSSHFVFKAAIVVALIQQRSAHDH